MQAENGRIERLRPAKPLKQLKPAAKIRLRTLNDLDKRTSAARAAIELRHQIVRDLGGDEGLSAMQVCIIDNVATLGASLADMAAAYLSGEQISLALYCTIANSQRRLLADLGLERRAADITPDLRDYVRGRAA